jgi:methionyl-tRNA formyltransferase
MGCTEFSKEILLSLLNNNFSVVAVFSIPLKFEISYSKHEIKNYNYADLNKIAKRNGIDFYRVKSSSGIIKYCKTIRNNSPDVILVAGWYYMVPRLIRKIAKYGAWGLHASLLPSYRGGAPLVWSMINGDKETGVTLFRLDNGVDSGDIIAQGSFPINFKDSIVDVYRKATSVSKRIILNAIKNIEKIEFQPQTENFNIIYPQREPKDGRINLDDSALNIYNFIRAQSKPYPGAFSMVDGKKITFWKVKYFKHVPNLENIGVREIFQKENQGFVKLRYGFLEVLYCRYGSRDGKFYNIANMENLWGKHLR